VKTGSWLIFILVPFLAGTVALLLGYSGWREIGRASQRFATALTEAEEANKAKDNFIAVLSHELRNPLNAIILLAAILLSKREIDEDVRERISAIDRAARTQARLIEDLLDVSRIGNGGLRLDMQAIDLVQVVKSTIDSMRVAAEAKSLTIENIIDPDIPITAGDPRRLAQAVENLLSNAVKFTSKGGMVQVRLQRVNSHLEIAIIDNGRGIAPSSIAHIFDRFWQGKDAGQHGSGAGPGLAIVKEVVMLHGGTVTVHSEGLGRGSTFTVRLPVPPVIAGFSEPVQHPAVAPVKNAGLAPRLDGYFILVVDDDPKACEALATLLNSVGARVRAENSVEEALKALDGRVPDVIIADIEMPIYDGFHLARQVRQREENMAAGQRIPIIALTAHGGVEDRIGILNSGFDIHLVKPVDVTELSAAIRSLVPAKAA
jgi:signal transduction histidine kinase/CheY-like chemotaxis protein